MTKTEQENTAREIKVKLIFKQPLSPYERSFYLLFMATAKQARKFIKRNRKVNL